MRNPDPLAGAAGSRHANLPCRAGSSDCLARNAVDIVAWLRELSLERYEQAFLENEIDARPNRSQRPRAERVRNAPAQS
jgi:hypothetical protein